MKTICLAVIGLGLIMFPGEAPDAMGQFLWSGSWLSAITMSGLTLKYLEKNDERK